MPKKQFLKEKKPNKSAPQQPESADEYLAVGVDYEEAGEKWRGGDAAKSARFFGRALNTYDEGLAKFPMAFDLSYNKARVQYELTQHPKILAALSCSVVDMLRLALASSFDAMNLNPENADVLFNTAQVLTSLAETFTIRGEGVENLREAVRLFQRCLTIQENSHKNTIVQEEAAQKEIDMDATSDNEEDGGVSSGQSQVTQEDQWATIVEPVTNDTLLDTIQAELEALTTLCSILSNDDAATVEEIENIGTPLVQNKLPVYLTGPDTGAERHAEAMLKRANFVAALADASFRNQRITQEQYLEALQAYKGLSLDDDPEGLCNKAEACIAYNSSVSQSKYNEGSRVMISRWNALTEALTSLTAASKLPSAEHLSKIHFARGDVELLRYQLGQWNPPYEPALKNAATLLKNAAIFYRGAGAHARTAASTVEIKESEVKAAMAQSLAGDDTALASLRHYEPAVCRGVFEEAVEEGLVTVDWIVQIDGKKR